MNIVYYASNSNSWPNRGCSPLQLPDPKVIPKRTIRVARLDYLGNSDPEPGGWENLSALMHNQFATNLETAFVKPTPQSLTRANPPFQVATLTGTTKFNLSDEARSEIAAFVQRRRHADRRRRRRQPPIRGGRRSRAFPDVPAASGTGFRHFAEAGGCHIQIEGRAHRSLRLSPLRERKAPRPPQRPAPDGHCRRQPQSPSSTARKTSATDWSASRPMASSATLPRPPPQSCATSCSTRRGSGSVRGYISTRTPRPSGYGVRVGASEFDVSDEP